MKIIDEELCPCRSGKLYRECHKKMLRTKTSVTNLNHISLPVIPEPDPDTRVVFKKLDGSDTTLVFDSQGHYSLDCGGCGSTLAVISDRKQIPGIVLHCVAYGKFNEA